MPTKEEIKKARADAGLTQTEAGKLVHVTKRGWQDWEYEVHPMNEAAWELFLLKTKKNRKQAQFNQGKEK